MRLSYWQEEGGKKSIRFAFPTSLAEIEVNLRCNSGGRGYFWTFLDLNK